MMQKIVLCIVIATCSALTTNIEAAASSRHPKKGHNRVSNFVTIRNRDITKHIGGTPIFSPRHEPEATSSAITTFPIAKCGQGHIKMLNDHRFIVTSATPDRNGFGYLLDKSTKRVVIIRGQTTPCGHAPEVAFQAFFGINTAAYALNSTPFSKTFAAQLLFLQMKTSMPMHECIKANPYFLECTKYEERNPGLLRPLSGEVLRQEGMKRLRTTFSPEVLARFEAEGKLNLYLHSMVKRILDKDAEAYKEHSLEQQSTFASSKVYWRPEEEFSTKY